MNGTNIFRTNQVSGLSDTLISVVRLCNRGSKTVFTAKEPVQVKRRTFKVPVEDIVTDLPSEKNSGIYPSRCIQKGALIKPSNQHTTLQLRHHWLIHISTTTMQKLNLHVHDAAQLFRRLTVCHPCELGNVQKKLFNSHTEKPNVPGKIVCSNLIGPVPRAVHVKQYLCTFIDQYSPFMHVAGFQIKCDTDEAIGQYRTLEHVQ